MSVTISTRQAYSELDEFLALLSEEQRNEIPQKLRQFFKEEKDREYVKKIDKEIPIKDQNLKEETLALIAMLNLQYWCKDEEEKKRLIKIYSDNEKRYQEELCKKYNPDNIFKNHQVNEKQNQVNILPVEFKKEKIFTRLLKFIKGKF